MDDLTSDEDLRWWSSLGVLGAVLRERWLGVLATEDEAALLGQRESFGVARTEEEPSPPGDALTTAEEEEVLPIMFM
jgi:hypothetical protein